MPDIPIVGTATVGAPGVTRKPILPITDRPLFRLSYRCNLWSRKQDFNPHPSPYRGDTLALSYAGLTSVVQILPPLLLAHSRLAHQSTGSMNGYAARLTKQLHTRFRRRTVRLPRIAVTARSD